MLKIFLFFLFFHMTLYVSHMAKKLLSEEIALFFILMCSNQSWLYYHNLHNELILNRDTY